MAALILVGMLRQGGTVRAGAPDGPPGDALRLSPPLPRPGAGAAPGASGAEAGDTAAARAGRDPALQAAVEGAVAEAVARAAELSGGAVDGRSAAVAVHVVEAGSGRELAAVQPDLVLRPASNMKLVTAAAALVLLGPDWHFETPFEARGAIGDGRLAGDLVARAAGDPLYEQGGDGALDAWLDDLAAQLRAAGIARVEGALVLDEGTFPEPGPGPAWPDPRDHWQEYCALAGGFSANAGCITATVRAGAVGAPASVRVRPRHHGLPRRGSVATGARRSRLDLAVEARRHGLTVRGSIPVDVPEYVTRFAHPDPVELFGHAVVGGLADRGVVVAGGWRRERGAAGGPLVARLRSPLAATLVPILTHSDNAVADQVFLALGGAVGGRADRAGGQAATRAALERLGVSDEGLVQVDGSGLSRDDRVAPRQLTALLAAVLARGGTLAERFLAALPVAGESGSLEGRMRDGPASGRVRAKTGFIGGTSGLSGVARDADGRTLVFSILVAYPRFGGLNTRVWKPMQDAIAERLASAGGTGR